MAIVVYIQYRNQYKNTLHKANIIIQKAFCIITIIQRIMWNSMPYSLIVNKIAILNGGLVCGCVVPMKNSSILRVVQ